MISTGNIQKWGVTVTSIVHQAIPTDEDLHWGQEGFKQTCVGNTVGEVVLKSTNLFSTTLSHIPPTLACFSFASYEMELQQAQRKVHNLPSFLSSALALCVSYILLAFLLKKANIKFRRHFDLCTCDGNQDPSLVSEKCQLTLAFDFQ